MHKNDKKSILISLSNKHRKVDRKRRQVAQQSQRDRAALWGSYGQKWKTGTGRQYLRTLWYVLLRVVVNRQ